jgi:hypothetical protein
MTTTMRRMNARTMTFFAVVSSSLLFLFILFEATSITGVHAQKELAFEEHNPSSSSLGKTTTRTPETITTEDGDDSTQKDAYGSEGGGEWQFATPASKGLSQSSLEVCSFFLSLSLFLYLIRESRGSHVEVGEHLSSSSSSLLPLSLSRLIIFWRSSRLSFDPRFK